jgi:hypothetical protein
MFKKKKKRMYCWLPMTRRRPPPQSWARPAQDGERRINVILNHKATVLFPKRHNVTWWQR